MLTFRSFKNLLKCSRTPRSSSWTKSPLSQGILVTSWICDPILVSTNPNLNFGFLSPLTFGRLSVRLRFPNARFAFSVFFFFLARVWETNTATVHAMFMNSSCKVWLFSLFQHKFYCSRTHKFHFSATFSLKMGLTVLFTHLKIILLQCFLVFSFSFQFSAVSKRTLNMTTKIK